MRNCAILARGLLAIKGETADTFLQNIVSVNIDAVPLKYGLLLTPQGKLQFDFFIWRKRNHIILDSVLDDQDSLRDALLGYRLRHKLSIEPIEGYVEACWGSTSPSAGAHVDVRWDKLGHRTLHLGETRTASGMEAWGLHRLRLGVAEGASEMGKGFPLEYRLDKFHAIDFHKGCFIGQEVCARSWRLGKQRKLLYPLEFDAAAPPPATPILTKAGRVAGEIRASLGKNASALLHRDYLNDGLSANGQSFIRLPNITA